MHKAGKYNEVYSVLKVYYSLACRSFLRSFLSVCVLLSTSYIEFAWFSLSSHESVGQVSLIEITCDVSHRFISALFERK